MSRADQRAIAEFPELQRLIDLREAAWSWLPGIRDGDLVHINGYREWPTGELDAIRVRSVTDVNGLRTLADELGVVWEQSGTLTEVVDGLLELPPPGTPAAPRLVRGRAPLLGTP